MQDLIETFQVFFRILSNFQFVVACFMVAVLFTAIVKWLSESDEVE